jgi:hypothetical protein
LPGIGIGSGIRSPIFLLYTLLLKNRTPLLIAILTVLLFLQSGCQRLIDPAQVLGSWVIRKDSSEMKIVFTSDTLVISYLPGSSRNVFSYQWKQDEEPGLMECYQETPLDSEKLARKIIASELYVIKVSRDSLSVLVPTLKTRFDLSREKK